MTGPRASRGRAPRKRRRSSVRHFKWTRLQYLEDALGQLEELAGDATEAKSFQAAVRAKTSACDVREEVDRLRTVAAQDEQPQTLEGQRAALLHRVRMLALKAEADKSFVACRDFIKMELELLDVEKKKQDEENQKRLRGVPQDAVVNMLREVLLDLPVAVRSQLLEGLVDEDA